MDGPPEVIDKMKKYFWLSHMDEYERETDATVVYNGKAISIDIGFIGRGNPEITLDKVTRFGAYKRIGGVNHDMATNAEIRQKVNNYLQLEEPYAGETRVLHYLEVLRDEIGWEKLAQLVSHPLKERRVGAYYGCLLLRPGAVLALDDVESPSIMEKLIRALGAEPVMYSMRNECCGGYLALENKAQCELLVSEIKANAASCGAQELVTACPLCAYNLTANDAAGGVPTRYFTELLAEALGVAGGEGGAE